MREPVLEQPRLFKKDENYYNIELREGCTISIEWGIVDDLAPNQSFFSSWDMLSGKSNIPACKPSGIYGCKITVEDTSCDGDYPSLTITMDGAKHFGLNIVSKRPSTPPPPCPRTEHTTPWRKKKT